MPVDLITTVPWPVWALTPALIVIAWLWASVYTAPMDTELWDGGEYGPSNPGPWFDDDNDEGGSADEAEPPLARGWGEERW